jgi:hypothetical protein
VWLGSLYLSAEFINMVAQPLRWRRPRPTSEELRAEINELRSTAARLQEQASRLVERRADWKI